MIANHISTYMHGVGKMKLWSTLTGTMRRSMRKSSIDIRTWMRKYCNVISTMCILSLKCIIYCVGVSGYNAKSMWNRVEMHAITCVNECINYWDEVILGHITCSYMCIKWCSIVVLYGVHSSYIAVYMCAIMCAIMYADSSMWRYSCEDVVHYMCGSVVDDGYIYY